ncbi:MAG: glutathione S-transferase N-terminal domain-containing protein [Porticoccaceae bacterium]
MIDLFYVNSPNVTKILIALEESGFPYQLLPVDLSKGDHLKPELVAGAVTGKLPFIRDNSPADGGESMVVFESGAILQYLAEKSATLLPADMRKRMEVMQWLFWQVGGLGPIGGQTWHFFKFAPLIAPDTDNSYAYNRYFHMFSALWQVMDRRLQDRDYLAGEYSIADIACFPWIAYLEPEEGAASYPNVSRWRDSIGARPAVRRAYEKRASVNEGYERNEQGMTLFPWEGLIKNVIVV